MDHFLKRSPLVTPKIPQNFPPAADQIRPPSKSDLVKIRGGTDSLIPPDSPGSKESSGYLLLFKFNEPKDFLTTTIFAALRAAFPQKQ
jgi:hypothetical protein